MQVPGAVNIAAIACGAFHNMALGADGRLLTWGTNDYGQLGNGSTIYSTTPVEVRCWGLRMKYLRLRVCGSRVIGC
jgi:alpha-tubulin suppressor-like RCC1 family protein